MHQNRLKRLLRQYFDNTINHADCMELLSYLDEHPQEVENHIDDVLGDIDAGPDFTQAQAHDVLNRIKADIRFADTEPLPNEAVVVKFYQKRWLQIAAMLVVILTTAILLLNKNTPQAVDNNITAMAQKPVVPGGNKATLTMADGKTIVLDSMTNGVVASNGASKIVKVGDGQLVYSAGTQTGAMAYNTLSTPRGGEYQITLADGTKVWLNAASSLSYPQEFTGTERRVQLTGEAYFEVAKNKDKPFYVTVNNVQVKVLGTHFNISAYNDEQNITTTLLEGAVQVTKDNEKSFLSPGQQAVTGNGSGKISVYNVDASDAVAWKNGYFVFNDEDIVSIMKKVSRWYDVEVEYRGDVGSQKFGGTFYRFKSINELVSYLEKIGKLHFKISGRRIIVMG